jgi:hypothetical protein
MAADVYQRPISVATYRPEVYKNLPYIDKVYHIHDQVDEHHIIRTFNTDKIKKFELLHEKVDIRQFHSLCGGFMLLPDQLHCDFIADPYEEIADLPERYVVLHTAKTWNSRTWPQEKWEELAAELRKAGVVVVSVGKTNNSAPDVRKPVFDVDVDLDLTDKLSLSQCWHVLDRARIVVTMDSGILHLAGTTDTHIIQLGSSIHPYYRAPYRNGTQQHKYTYIKGDCNLFCASSLAYTLRKDVPVKISECAEGYETFECHPPVQKVLKKVLKLCSI